MTASVILKFGPGVTPDPTKPIQNHLRKNLGRLSAPVNQKTRIQSVRIVQPGMPFHLHFLQRLISVKLTFSVVYVPFSLLIYLL